MLNYPAPAHDRAKHRLGLPAGGEEGGELALRTLEGFSRSAERVPAALARHVRHWVLIVGHPGRAAATLGARDADVPALAPKQALQHHGFRRLPQPPAAPPDHRQPPLVLRQAPVRRERARARGQQAHGRAPEFPTALARRPPKRESALLASPSWARSTSDCLLRTSWRNLANPRGGHRAATVPI